ncbi:hypothetical protein YC2023_117106 [Brassica napus]
MVEIPCFRLWVFKCFIQSKGVANNITRELHVLCLGLDILDQFLGILDLTLIFVGNQQGGSGSRMRNVVRLRRVRQVSGAAGYDGSSESSSSSESESDSNFENENAVESTDNSHETGSSDFEEVEVLEEIEEESDNFDGMNFFQGMEAIPQSIIRLIQLPVRLWQ